MSKLANIIAGQSSPDGKEIMRIDRSIEVVEVPKCRKSVQCLVGRLNRFNWLV